MACLPWSIPFLLSSEIVSVPNSGSPGLEQGKCLLQGMGEIIPGQEARIHRGGCRRKSFESKGGKSGEFAQEDFWTAKADAPLWREGYQCPEWSFLLGIVSWRGGVLAYLNTFLNSTSPHSSLRRSMTASISAGVTSLSDLKVYAFPGT
jgi:hypothetical protein